MEIHARNTNDLQHKVYSLIQEHGVERQSRNGPVLMFPEPVSICIRNPWERVNFCPVRDANPFFHLVEGLAMIADFNSVELLSYFAKGMTAFSDNGVDYNAFYGTRLRSRWGDQLQRVIDILRKDPDSRQAVANLWDPEDLTRVTKDKACNLMLLFSVNAEGKLCMTSFNRSNDAVLGGVTGANIVHLSMFQEFVALALGRDQGPWWHVSNNLHVYTETFGAAKWKALKDQRQVFDLYATDRVLAEVLFDPDHQQEGEFTEACYSFCSSVITFEGYPEGLANKDFGFDFLNHTARPLVLAWRHRKAKNLTASTAWLKEVRAADWRTAAQLWVSRRTGGSNNE